MGSSYLGEPLVFLVDTLLGLYIMVVMLRFLFQWVNADFRNPVSQFLVKVTHPLLRPLRRIIPSIGRIDTASIVLMVLLQMVTGYVLFQLQGAVMGPLPLLIWSVAELIAQLINIYIFAILISVIISWISPGGYNPVVSLLYSLTEPFLRIFRKIIPSISGFDISPIFALIALNFGKMLILRPMHDLMLLVS
ncbi:MAG: YggT family protein [Methylococcales bacterium]